VNNPYKVLQVDPSAEQEVIEAAFRRLARKYHPDVNPAPEAAARMRELLSAYEVLKDPVQRAALDRRRGGGGPWLRWRERYVADPPPPPPPPSPSPAASASATRAPGRATAEPATESQGPWQDRPLCSRHVGRPAVSSCGVCGSSLCSWCASLFQPAGCARCVWRLARRAQRRALVGMVVFAIAFVLALDLTVVQAGVGFVLGLLLAYLVAATALGIAVMVGRMWRSGWQDEPQDWGFGVTFLVWAGILLGWVGAPVMLGKMALDLRRGRQLAALAGNVLQS
jgi:DnaJ-like protein